MLQDYRVSPKRLLYIRENLERARTDTRAMAREMREKGLYGSKTPLGDIEVTVKMVIKIIDAEHKGV